MLDAKDKVILNILQENAKTTNAEIARKVGMAPSAVLERIRKLEKKGVIGSYETRLNAKNLGLDITTYVLIRTDESIASSGVGKKLAEIAELQEVHVMAGEFSYLIKVRVKNTDALARLLKDVGKIKGAKDSKTMLVLETLKETSAISLGDC